MSGLSDAEARKTASEIPSDRKSVSSMSTSVQNPTILSATSLFMMRSIISVSNPLAKPDMVTGPGMLVTSARSGLLSLTISEADLIPDTIPFLMSDG